MSRGYPDRFGQQEFPKYGGAKHYDSGFIEVNIGQTKMLINRSFKGMIYGGKIVFSGEFEIPSGMLRLRIDLGNYINITMNTLFLYHIFTPGVGPFYLLSRDDTLDRLVIAISPGITIDSGFKLEIQNNSSDNFQAAADIYYTHLL